MEETSAIKKWHKNIKTLKTLERLLVGRKNDHTTGCLLD